MALSVALVLLAAAASAPAQERVERRLAAMGTWLELEVGAPERATALAASEAAVRALERCEARLSTWRDDSELARLNAAPVGAAIELSPELAADLAGAARYWRLTGGAFDPGLGALVAAWGLRAGGRRPSAGELADARAAGGFAGLELSGARAVRRHALARVEEGGFGKGIGLDAALAALRAAGAGEARLDLGGQVLVHGRAASLGLAHPDARERIVLALEIEGGSLATSGNSERGIVVDGERLGHLLDPRTGAPAPDFGSLTVWAPDGLAADCLSTGLYVLGPEEALRWHAAARVPGVELVVLARAPGGLRARATAGLAGRLRVLDPSVSLEVVQAEVAPDAPAAPPPSR